MTIAYSVNIVIPNNNTNIPQVHRWEHAVLLNMYYGIITHMRKYDNEAWQYEGGYYDDEFVPTTSLGLDFKNKHTGDDLQVTVEFNVDMKIGENASPAINTITVSVNNRNATEPEQVVHVPFDNFATSTPADGIWDAVFEALQQL